MTLSFADSLEQGGLTFSNLNIVINREKQLNVITKIDRSCYGCQSFYLLTQYLPKNFEIEIQSPDKDFIHKTSIDLSKVNFVDIDYYWLYSILPLSDQELKTLLPKTVILKNKKYKVKLDPLDYKSSGNFKLK